MVHFKSSNKDINLLFCNNFHHLSIYLIIIDLGIFFAFYKIKTVIHLYRESIERRTYHFPCWSRGGISFRRQIFGVLSLHGISLEKKINPVLLEAGTQVTYKGKQPSEHSEQSAKNETK